MVPFVLPNFCCLVPEDLEIVKSLGCILCNGPVREGLIKPVEKVAIVIRQCVCKHDLAHFTWLNAIVFQGWFRHVLFQILIVDDDARGLVRFFDTGLTVVRQATVGHDLRRHVRQRILCILRKACREEVSLPLMSFRDRPLYQLVIVFGSRAITPQNRSGTRFICDRFVAFLVVWAPEKMSFFLSDAVEARAVLWHVVWNYFIPSVLMALHLNTQKERKCHNYHLYFPQSRTDQTLRVLVSHHYF